MANIQVINAILREDYRTRIATDGERALALAFASPLPHLVLLDVMMPGLTGWEIAKYLRTKELFKATPVLMLTGIGERMNALTAPLYGATHHMDKPFDIDDLLSTVAGLLPD
jgi:CheY-like chemotaxis protein